MGYRVRDGFLSVLVYASCQANGSAWRGIETEHVKMQVQASYTRRLGAAARRYDAGFDR